MSPGGPQHSQPDNHLSSLVLGRTDSPVKFKTQNIASFEPLFAASMKLKLYFVVEPSAKFGKSLEKEKSKVALRKSAGVCQPGSETWGLCDITKGQNFLKHFFLNKEC